MSERRVEKATAKFTLDLRQAAVHCGLLVSTFAKLVEARILPGSNCGCGWSQEKLDGAIEDILLNGLPPNTVLPYTHRPPRRLVDGTKRWHTGWRHGNKSKLINHPIRSAAFAREWLAWERQYAAQQKLHDDPPAPVEAGIPRVPGLSDLVTEGRANESEEAPFQRVLRIPRRRARFSQADVARIIRAARLAGAVRVELRLNDSSAVVVHLNADNPLAQTEEIVL